MSAPYNLSGILTNVNWAVYQNDEPDSQMPPVLAVKEPLSALANTPTSNSLIPNRWCHVAPQFWGKQDTLEWISSHVEESQFDASSLNLAYCAMDGATLCQLSHDSLLSLFGPLGERLFQSLLELKARHGADDLNLTCNFLSNLMDEFPEILNVSEEDSSFDLNTVIEVADKRGNDMDTYIQDRLMRLGEMTPVSDNGYESGGTSPDSLTSSSAGTHIFVSPRSPDSAGNDSDQEGILKARAQIKTERGEMKQCKRTRGRPRKLSHSSERYTETKKSKNSPRGTHLWEFIRDILIHPEQNHGLLKWEDRIEGVFKFLKSEAVAQLWGRKKKNSSMTYEKLSRAMRYYYRRGILERVDGRRLVYKFGKNSRGWKLGEAGVNI